MQDADLIKDLSVRDLRRRWKPIKEGAAAADAHGSVRIRLHRCWSWMRRVEEISEAGTEIDDARLIYGWIALNSLYGRWDATARKPMEDFESQDAFLKRLIEFDQDSLIAGLLESERDLVKAIVGDEFLNRIFWQDPCESEARKAQNMSKKIGSWYHDKLYAVILDEVLSQVYLARCQLVHGAATCNSALNRESIERSARFLDAFLRTASVIVIDHAWREYWDDLCYPPMD